MIRCYKIIDNIFHLQSRFKLILLISSVIINLSFSQNTPLPENFQAALLVKVLKFSPTLSQKSKLRILIVYDTNSKNSKDVLIRMLDGFMDVKSIYPDELKKNISNADLVYFMPDIMQQAALCKEYKVLSVSGYSENIRQGKISLAFGVRNNKPKIFINLNSLEEEGQTLSSDILRIAEVYQ